MICAPSADVIGLPVSHVHADLARALPAERVEDEHRNSLAGCVHVLGNRRERTRRDLVRRPVNDVVVLLRVLIDDADARTGSEIVELVEENFLPILGQFAGWIFIAVEPRERRPLLGVKRPDRRFAHVAFVIGLRGHHAAVILEVELALPRRESRPCPVPPEARIALSDGLVVPLRTLGSDTLLDAREVLLRRSEVASSE